VKVEKYDKVCKAKSCCDFDQILGVFGSTKVVLRLRKIGLRFC